MRQVPRAIARKPRAKKARPSYDPYSSYGMDDSAAVRIGRASAEGALARTWVGPLPAKVISVLDLTEDVLR